MAGIADHNIKCSSETKIHRYPPPNKCIRLKVQSVSKVKSLWIPHALADLLEFLACSRVKHLRDARAEVE